MLKRGLIAWISWTLVLVPAVLGQGAYPAREDQFVNDYAELLTASDAAEVRAAGIACALVSASYTSILEAITAQLPAHSFDLVIGGDQVKNGKPHPEPYLTAASRLGVAPIDCLVLEDSVPGTLSAENAGMPTLGVPFEQPLTDGPRRRVIPTLSGLTLAAASELWRELAHA